MAKNPKGRYGSDEADEPSTEVTTTDYAPAATETEGTGELPSQLQPYPTGNPPPNRDYFGRYVDEAGVPVNADGSPIVEETP
jgi:hypothetical protein